MKKFFASLFLLAMLTLALGQTSTYDLWFTWKANPAHESVTSYVIEQAKFPSTNFVAIVTISGATNVGVIKGLTAGTYKFRVFAKNGVGNGTPSSVLDYPTNAPTPVLEFNFTTPR